MKRGFTLIELLVVMTIISLLLGVSLVAYSSSRKGARDSKREADLEQLRSALEIYRSDNGGYPPSLDPTGPLTCHSNTYSPGLADPVSPAYYYVYKRGQGWTQTNGCDGPNTGISTYTLCAHLENQSGPDVCGGTSCGGTCNYAVTNP